MGNRKSSTFYPGFVLALTFSVVFWLIILGAIAWLS